MMSNSNYSIGLRDRDETLVRLETETSRSQPCQFHQKTQD